MATTDKMAHAVRTDERRSDEKETSISARVIRTISVNMSITEIDTLVYSFGKMRDELTNGERTVQDEFMQAVEAVRFAER